MIMKKKMNGLVKFLIICGVIAAAAAAVAAVLMKMKKKLCPACDEEEPEECDGECCNCNLCDVDDECETENDALESDIEETEEMSEEVSGDDADSSDNA